jgi:hypothetical protein
VTTPLDRQPVTAALAAVMAVQAASGLLFPSQYRDPLWISATWFGNDCVTLAVAVPLLVAGRTSAARGSARGRLLWLGMLGYAIYNYAFYLFGAAFNAFFPLYLLAFLLAVTTLVHALIALDPRSISAAVAPTAPARLIGAWLVFLGVGLACVWIAMWAAHVFAGWPTPVEPEAFKLIAALDLSLMVPALVLGGVLSWRREPWGYVASAIASSQAGLYLLVLSVNSIVAIARGFVEAPGELPIWGALTLITVTVVGILFANVSDDRCEVRP